MFHLLGTGRQQFVENGGVEILKRFCFNVAGEKVDKRWDRLLCRSCVILSRCCPSASLPVSSDGCPIKFDISREHSFLPEGTRLYNGHITRQLINANKIVVRIYLLKNMVTYLYANFRVFFRYHFKGDNTRIR